jgi:hypothetical protein
VARFAPPSIPGAEEPRPGAKPDPQFWEFLLQKNYREVEEVRKAAGKYLKNKKLTRLCGKNSDFFQHYG